MRTIETTQKAGADKMLHLTIPVDEADRAYRMVIVVVPESDDSTENSGWPPGFIESTYGSIQDDTFVRHPQGESEKRLNLE